jgi:GDP-L-fucose synthase
MNEEARIFVAGHGGLVGGAIVGRLTGAGHRNLILRTRGELDLRKTADVEQLFTSTRPEYVFLAAAKVGGIHANDRYPAEFICDNLKIQTNIIDAAYRLGTRKLLFLGSSCVYPRLAPQPIPEDALLTGPLEPTNEAYAIAKIAGLEMCKAYRRQYGFDAIVAMPTNLYGPGDNFSLKNSHVLPALIRKFHDAKAQGDGEVTVWGSGTPRREFLHVNDLADACVHLMQHYSDEQPVNIGWGEDISIAQLVQEIASAVGYGGTIRYDATKPDGTPRKLLDVTRMKNLGWAPRITLLEGIASTYSWFLQNQDKLRR